MANPPNYNDIKRQQRLAVNNRLSFKSVLNGSSPTSQNIAAPAPTPTITPTPTRDNSIPYVYSNIDGLVIKDLNFDYIGSGPAGYYGLFRPAILITDCKNITITGCNISSLSGACIYMVNAENVLVKDNVFKWQDNKTDIYNYGDEPSHFQNLGRISFAYVSNLSVLNNEHYNHGDGTYVYQSSGVIIDNNYFHNGFWTPIALNGCYGFGKITNNICYVEPYTEQQYGFDFINIFQTSGSDIYGSYLVKNNLLYSNNTVGASPHCCGAGITVENFSNKIEVIDNIISDTGAGGITFANGASNSIAKGNVVFNKPHQNSVTGIGINPTTYNYSLSYIENKVAWVGYSNGGIFTNPNTWDGTSPFYRWLENYTNSAYSQGAIQNSLFINNTAFILDKLTPYKRDSNNPLLNSSDILTSWNDVSALSFSYYLSTQYVPGNYYNNRELNTNDLPFAIPTTWKNKSLPILEAITRS